MKNIKILLLIINLAFIGNLFPAAAREDLLKSFQESHDTSYIPQGEIGFKKVLNLIYSPEYKKYLSEYKKEEAEKAKDKLRNAKGQNLIYIAILALRVDIVQLLLDNGESIYSVDKTPSSALEVANNVKERIENDIHANELERTEYGQDAIIRGVDLKKAQERLSEELKAINNIIVLIKTRQDIHSAARVLLTRMDQTIPEEGLIGIPKTIREIILEYLQA